VLANAHKVRGFKPGRRRLTLKGDKVRSTTSFERGSKAVGLNKLIACVLAHLRFLN
jgi:hypothetical protein